MEDRLQLEASWKQRLASVFDLPELHALRAFLQSERSAGHKVYPPMHDVFNAFTATPFDKVKVVILGQDPYHGFGQAHGLSFSVRPGVAIPPSLHNIYKELQTDLGIAPVKHGYLQSWAERGVLLLNAVLTVRANTPDSHKERGWEWVTDTAVSALNAEREGLVFLLWGRNARVKAARLDRQKHLVLECAHPSPMSARNGFFGCKHFSKANDYLIQRGIEAVDWQLPVSVAD
jgi:uracil-DNA glycosylase